MTSFRTGVRATWQAPDTSQGAMNRICMASQYSKY